MSLFEEIIIIAEGVRSTSLVIPLAVAFTILFLGLSVAILAQAILAPGRLGAIVDQARGQTHSFYVVRSRASNMTAWHSRAQDEWADKLVLYKTRGYPPWPGWVIKPVPRDELQSPMYPLAPPSMR